MSSMKIKEQISWFPETLIFLQLPLFTLFSPFLHHQKAHLLPHLAQTLSLSFCHFYNPPLMAVAGSFFCSRYFSLEKIKSMEDCLEQQWLLLSALAVCQDLATCLEEVLFTGKCHPSVTSLLPSSRTQTLINTESFLYLFIMIFMKVKGI